ncbi:MAG: N-acetylneuraminate synthase [Rickettsiales bacterium]|nr:N-acetylneuraminate synthase [Rickettsiales bacterium]
MFLPPQSVYLIAEAGVNHDGSEASARELVDIAADSGADAVKFQLFSPEALVTPSAHTADYQSKNLKDTQVSQRQMLEKLTLPTGAMARLWEYCEKKNIDFLCTPFDAQSLNELVATTQMPYLKLASGEVTNGPLLLAAARTGMPVILSTGMSSLDEISAALSVLYYGYHNAAGFPARASVATPEMLADLREKVTLLQCVSQYPAPVHTTNLLAMDTLEQTFSLYIGLSDHSLGLTMSIAAAARGARIIEKHFTYDVAARGPDHAASLSPEGLKALVAAIRDVSQGLGTGEKECQIEEASTRSVARRSVVAATAIPRGTPFTEQNLTAKRPASGLSPNRLWELLGRVAKRDYAAEEFIDPAELK